MNTVRRVVSLASAIALLAVGTALAAPANAQAGNPTCGATITQNTTLTANIGPCPGEGLRITASDITLNLNGRRIFGAPGYNGDLPGIALLGVTGVTVRGGTVDNFEAGVMIFGGGNNRVTGMTVRDNFGILEYGPEQAAANLGDGIVMFDSNDNTIQNNTVDHNGPFAGIAMVGTTSRTRVLSNIVRNNNLVYTENGVPDFSEDFGIKVEGPGASFNLIQGNSVSRSGTHGISVTPTCPDFETNPDDFNCLGPLNEGNIIRRNVSNFNGVPQAAGGGADGIRLLVLGIAFGPVRTLVEGNVTNFNTLNGIGLDRGDINFPNRGASDNTMRNNVARGNATAGRPNTFDAKDDNQPPRTPPCDNNHWLPSNRFGTVNHPCVRNHP
jgi:parallel beta-helix repeat protein